MRVLGNATIMSRFVNEFVRASTCKATAKFRSAKLLSVDMASASVNQSIRLSTNSSFIHSLKVSSTGPMAQATISTNLE